MGTMRKKKVLMLAVCHPDAIGGQAACARMLLNRMKDLDWIAISFPLPGKHRSFTRFILSVKILFQATWICLSRKIEVVHLLTACGRAALFEKLIIARILKLTGVKVILNFQGAFDEYYSRFSGTDQKRIIKLLRSIDVVLCLHKDMEKYLLMNGIVSPGKIAVIPNAVPIDPVPVKTKALNHRVRLLYLGWLVSNKGLHTLVRAAGILAGEMKTLNFSLDLVGPEVEPALIRILKEEAVKGGVGEHISFHPPVDGDEKRKVFSAADIFVFPTRMEGFPFVLLEAMQAELAVVTTDISPMNLIVTHNVNGLLFERDNAGDLARHLHRLIHSPADRERLSVAARLHVAEQYSVEKIISMYGNLYAALS